jgi:hypothetical protein
MKAIWKFPLPPGSFLQPLYASMPADARVIHVGVQAGIITLWAEVDTGAPYAYRTFRVYGTGWDHQPKPQLEHLGTVQVGSFVWHVYG